MADIRSVEQILAADALDSGKSLVVSRLQIRCRSQDHEDAAAVGDKRMTCLVESLVALSKLLERRTHVIDMHGRVIENLIHAGNLVALLIGTRVALGRHDETHYGIGRPLGHGHRDIIRHIPENLENIRLKTRQNHLSLRITEAAIELDDLDAVRSFHQTAVEDTLERNPLGNHAGRDRLHDMLQRINLILLGNERKRSICTHATGIRPLITVKGTFMILRQHHKAADLVISRAGASSISEFCLIGKPVILVPSPNVAEDHQTKNAMALVNKDAALYIKDADAPDTLLETAVKTVKDSELLSQLATNIKELGKPASADIIADEVLKLAGK